MHKKLASPTRWAAAMLLIAITAGCGEAIQENQDLQMDRRQVDTYGDEPAAPEENQPLLEAGGGDDGAEE